jgi:pimeloyl-ACP methyl ester carboxylesterase
MEELGVYIVGFDRAGYGESDPNPNRSVQSTALDIEDLADALELGSKFYLVSRSIGGHAAWGAIKYIPHRYATLLILCILSFNI